MTIRITAADANNDGTGIDFAAFLANFEATFVRSGFGQFSGANGLSGKEYSFTNGSAEKTGLVLGSGDAEWAYSMTTHQVTGSLNSVKFGSATVLDRATGAFTQVSDLIITGLDIDDTDDASVALSELMAAKTDSVLEAVKDDTLVFVGSSGKDSFRAFEENDKLFGYGGDDGLSGGAGNDRLVGGDGNDGLLGGGGNDVLLGDAGNDRLRAGAGNDTAKGGLGNDVLYGDAGNDKLFGDAGNDTINGGTGDDRITGGAGEDKLTGSLGKDTFIFATNTGDDTITDFAAGELVGDIIILEKDVIASFTALKALAEDTDAGLHIDYGTGSITLTGVELADLHRNDFLFI